jgi:protein ImuB
MLWIALWLPSLPLDVFARGLDPRANAGPFAVTSGGHYPQVVTVNAAARAMGVKRGQLVSAALALAPGIALRDRDLVAESASLGDLAAFMLGFTPQASIAPPDAVLADLGSSLRLFGGLARLLRLIGGGIDVRGYRLSPGVAPTPVAALALARARQSTPVFARNDLPSMLAPMPLTRFDIDPPALAMLQAAGVTTFGEACALPRDALARRCGPALVALCDRALGNAPDTRAPYVPPPHFASRLVLPVPVQDVAALGFAVNRLVHDLSAWLLARGLGVARIGLVLDHERHHHRRIGTAATRVEFALGAPTRTVAHLNTVLRERLARIALPAPVETITLSSEDTTPLAGHNLDWLPGNDRDAVVVPLADRLRARLGEGSVVCIAPQAEHRPEAALAERAVEERPKSGVRDDFPQSHVVSVDGSGKSSLTPLLRGNAAAKRPARLRHGTQVIPGKEALAMETLRAAPSAPRPLWLLSEPASLSPAFEHAPWVLRDGPERIESGWWDGGDVRRDYFIAQTPEGGITWIYRDHRRSIGDGEWFLHGLFA